MFDGGDATCAAGRFKGQWNNKPSDEAEYRAIILRGQNCPDYKQVQTPAAGRKE
jgi:hypothetical protein